jgi:hypothetical protein
VTIDSVFFEPSLSPKGLADGADKPGGSVDD